MVPPLEIFVDGKGSSFRTAERGYLRLRIESTSTDQAKAFADVEGSVTTMTSVFRALAVKTTDGRPHPDAAVTAFTVTPIGTVSQLQRDKNYRTRPELPKEHTVSASADIIFRDMAKLAEVSSDLAQMRHVSTTNTEWRLTDATRAELEREARVKAIADAVQKAQDYAGVVGRQVVAVEIRDQPQVPSFGPYALRNGHVQMMQQQAMVQQQQQQQMAQQAAQVQGQAQVSSTAMSEALTLEPKTITVMAFVSAKFVSVDDVGLPGRKRSREADDVDW